MMRGAKYMIRETSEIDGKIINSDELWLAETAAALEVIVAGQQCKSQRRRRYAEV
jgi:hypothetical protein